MKRKRIAIIGLIIIAIIGIVVFKYQQPKVIQVKEVKTENVQVKLTVSASGTINSQNQADLAFSSSGLITRLNVTEGEKVLSGQILAQVYDYSQSQTSQAYKDSRDVAIRNKDIYVKSVDSPSQIDFRQSEEYKLQIRRYDELISQAEALYQAQLAGVSNTYMKSPFDGTIVDISKEVGEVATAGQVYIKIADLNNLYLEVSLDQEDFGKVIVGQKAIVTLDSHPDVEFIAIVKNLPQYAETALTGTEDFVIEIEIMQNEENKILLGMTGDVDIVVAETATAVSALSFDSIFTNDNNSHYIWIVENNKLKKQQVEIGIEGDIYTEIIEDLSKYKIVIPVDKQTPEEGMTVKFN